MKNPKKPSHLRMTIVIDLTQPVQTLWLNVRRTRRHDIQNGFKKAVCTSNPNPKQIQEFLKIARPNASYLVKTGRVHITYDGKRVLAGIVTHFRDETVLMRTVSSIREEHNAHAALMWYTILWAKYNGFKEYDQCGYSLKTEKYRSVSSWKKSFGGTICERQRP